MPDDCQLYWSELIRGDEKALEAIFLQFHKELFQYGYKIAANRSLVDDCIQDLFLELWQSRTRLSVPDFVKSYLFRALRYKMIRALKKESVVPGVDDDFDSLLEFDYESTLIQQEVQEEIRQKLLKQISLLTPRQQEALYLRYYARLNYQEIGKIMGISSQAVTNLVFKSIKSLKENMHFPAMYAGYFLLKVGGWM